MHGQTEQPEPAARALERAATVISAMPAALALFAAPDLRREAANPEYVALVGRELPAPVVQTLRRVLSNGSTETATEIELQNGRAAQIYLDFACRCIRDDGGQPAGVLVAAIEVTERVRARERMIAEAEKNARLLRLLPMPFFSVTDEWVINYLNPAAERILKLRAEDVRGKNLWDAFPGLRASRFGEGYLRAMNEGCRTVTADYYPDFDRWYEAWAYPFDRGLAISFADVTERKREELTRKAETEKLEAIFYGSASPMVFFRGPDLVYEMTNAKYDALVPNRELLGKPLEVALPELTGTGFPELIRRVFDTGVPVTTHEEYAPLVNPLTGEVEPRYFDSGISRVNDGEGNPYGVFVQATEVTERVLSRKKIEDALAARDTFLSIASHELRTPITGMKLQVQMVKRALLRDEMEALNPARLKKMLDLTDRGLTRMSRLVEDMLDIARIHAGKLALDSERTDLGAFLRESLERYSEDLARAGIALTLQAARGLFVSIDRFRIEQVLTNLVTNAIKYAPGAPVHISVRRAGDAIEFCFEDGGRGIPASDLERIFERFERLAPAAHQGGLGLGLYIVRKIVEAHGGRIHAESRGGRGARFVVVFPAAPV
jgi:signal transduction histidine kinase